eukprot:2679291-Pleurochrysis_carterae.AAC.1
MVQQEERRHHSDAMRSRRRDMRRASKGLRKRRGTRRQCGIVLGEVRRASEDRVHSVNSSAASEGRCERACWSKVHA